MSYRPKFFAAAVALPLAASVWLVTTREPEPPPAPPTLAERLLSTDAAKRDKAEREITDLLPEPAMAVVWDLEQIDEFAARDAAARWRREIERRAADLATHGSRVHSGLPAGQPAPLVEVLTALQSQTGNSCFLLAEQESRPVTFQGDQIPFWQALDDVASQAGLAVGGGPITLGRDNIAFHMRRPEDDAVKVGYAGPVRLAAGPVDLHEADGRRLVHVPLEIRAEPRLTPLFVSFAARDLTVTTSDGRSFPLMTPDGNTELRFGMTGKVIAAVLDFESSDAPAAPLNLTGRMTVAFSTDKETFQFPIRTDSAGGELHDRTLTAQLLSARVGTGSSEFDVLYTSDSRPTADHLVHDAELVYPIRTPFWHDASIPASARPSVTPTADGDVVHYTFGPVPPDFYSLSLHCRVATDVLEVPVEVAIHDLTLPSGPLNAGSAAAP